MATYVLPAPSIAVCMCPIDNPSGCGHSTWQSAPSLVTGGPASSSVDGAASPARSRSTGFTTAPSLDDVAAGKVGWRRCLPPGRNAAVRRRHRRRRAWPRPASCMRSSRRTPRGRRGPPPQTTRPALRESGAPVTSTSRQPRRTLLVHDGSSSRPTTTVGPCGISMIEDASFRRVTIGTVRASPNGLSRSTRFVVPIRRD